MRHEISRRRLWVFEQDFRLGNREALENYARARAGPEKNVQPCEKGHEEDRGVRASFGDGNKEDSSQL